MTLAQWVENGWPQPHKTNRKEIANLFGIVNRDLLAAKASITADWQFGIAYDAALKLCTILCTPKAIVRQAPGLAATA